MAWIRLATPTETSAVFDGKLCIADRLMQPMISPLVKVNEGWNSETGIILTGYAATYGTYKNIIESAADKFAKAWLWRHVSDDDPGLLQSFWINDGPEIEWGYGGANFPVPEHKPLVLTGNPIFSEEATIP